MSILDLSRVIAYATVLVLDMPDATFLKLLNGHTNRTEKRAFRGPDRYCLGFFCTYRVMMNRTLDMLEGTGAWCNGLWDGAPEACGKENGLPPGRACGLPVTQGVLLTFCFCLLDFELPLTRSCFQAKALVRIECMFLKFVNRQRCFAFAT